MVVRLWVQKDISISISKQIGYQIKSKYKTKMYVLLLWPDGLLDDGPEAWVPWLVAV
jgi:hypothetical protein